LAIASSRCLMRSRMTFAFEFMSVTQHFWIQSLVYMQRVQELTANDCDQPGVLASVASLCYRLSVGPGVPPRTTPTSVTPRPIVGWLVGFHQGTGRRGPRPSWDFIPRANPRSAGVRFRLYASIPRNVAAASRRFVSVWTFRVRKRQPRQ
jgi:hypothetical protein